MTHVLYKYHDVGSCISLGMSGAVLFLGRTRLVDSSGECLLLTKIVKIFPVQHLCSLSLTVDLKTNAILSVDFAKSVVFLISV